MRWLQLGGETEEPIEARGPPRVNQSGHEPDELPPQQCRKPCSVRVFWPKMEKENEVSIAGNVLQLPSSLANRREPLRENALMKSG